MIGQIQIGNNWTKKSSMAVEKLQKGKANRNALEEYWGMWPIQNFYSTAEKRENFLCHHAFPKIICKSSNSTATCRPQFLICLSEY